jgi:hypothetical protein
MIIFFLDKCIYEVMWKNIEESGMRFAYWITKAIDTYS